MSAVVIAQVQFKNLDGSESKSGYSIGSAILAELADGLAPNVVAEKLGVPIFQVLAVKKKMS